MIGLKRIEAEFVEEMTKVKDDFAFVLEHFSNEVELDNSINSIENCFKLMESIPKDSSLYELFEYNFSKYIGQIMVEKDERTLQQ